MNLSGSSSNTTLVPNGNITFGGSGASRTVTVAPAAGQTGTATITVTVADAEGGTASSAFVLTINSPPTISAINDQTTNEDTPTNAISFTVGDAETPAANLTVSGTSSNQTLVPNGNITFGGAGASRTVTVSPAPNHRQSKLRQTWSEHVHRDKCSKNRSASGQIQRVAQRSQNPSSKGPFSLNSSTTIPNTRSHNDLSATRPAYKRTIDRSAFASPISTLWIRSSKSEN